MDMDFLEYIYIDKGILQQQKILIENCIDKYLAYRAPLFRAAEERLQLPKIHLVINNRVSEYQLRQVLLNSEQDNNLCHV